MSLDDRLRTALKSEPEVRMDPTLELDRFYAHAKPRRTRRQIATALASAVLVAGGLTLGAAGIADLRRPANFAVSPPNRVATPQPAPEALKQAAGVEQAYLVARGRTEGRPWQIWAYEDGDKPCLWRGGLEVAAGSCWAGGFELETGLDAGAMSTGEPGKPTLHVFDGYAPLDVARVRITSGSGSGVEVPTVRAGSSRVAFYAAVLTGDEWAVPVRYSLLDAAGRNVSAPMCKSDQYTIRVDQGRTRVGAADPRLGVEGLRGRRPCRMALEASLTVEDADGPVAEIEGNGALARYHEVVRDATRAIVWRWSNWCGSVEALRYVFRLGDRIVASEAVHLEPGCVDPSRPSVLRTSTQEPPAAES